MHCFARFSLVGFGLSAFLRAGLSALLTRSRLLQAALLDEPTLWKPHVKRLHTKRGFLHKNYPGTQAAITVAAAPAVVSDRRQIRPTGPASTLQDQLTLKCRFRC